MEPRRSKHFLAHIPTIALLVVFAMSAPLGVLFFILRAIDRDAEKKEQENAEYSSDFRPHERVFRLFDLDKAAAGFHNTHGKKQHEQPIADCLQGTVDAGHHAPNLPALEGLRAFGQQRPNLRQLIIPCGERGVQVRYDP